MYPVEGTPGTGKTTLGLAFLLPGAAVGKTGLYITVASKVELGDAHVEADGFTPDVRSIRNHSQPGAPPD